MNSDLLGLRQAAARVRVARLALEVAEAYGAAARTVDDEALRTLFFQIRDERLDLGTSLERLVWSNRRRSPQNGSARRAPRPRRTHRPDEMSLLRGRERDDRRLVQQTRTALRMEEDPALRELLGALEEAISDARLRIAEARSQRCALESGEPSGQACLP